MNTVYISVDVGNGKVLRVTPFKDLVVQDDNGDVLTVILTENDIKEIVKNS